MEKSNQGERAGRLGERQSRVTVLLQLPGGRSTTHTMAQQRFYRNTQAWLMSLSQDSPSHTHTHTHFCVFISPCFTRKHTPACLLILLIMSHLKQAPSQKQQIKFLTCLWYLPSFVKSQLWCLYSSLPLSLFSFPSLSLSLSSSVSLRP